MTREAWLLIIVNAALAAGKEILTVYNTDFNSEVKADNSPITEADEKAHSVISEALKLTGIPILSEEGSIPAYKERKNWKQFWMVDPLDGTKEFINRNGEFTVNIALIENGKPTMGVIYIPVSKTLYFADQQAYKIGNYIQAFSSLDELLGSAQTLPFTQNRTSFIMVGSRSHLNDETEAYFNTHREQYEEIEILQKGSSLKFCMIAEGSADSYPRLSPTMEWDTAAAHAIVKASGAEVLNRETKQPLEYNKENLLNPSFLVERP